MNKTNNLMNEETTNSSLRTGSQSTISELPTISPLAVTDKTMVENDTGTYNTTVGDIVSLVDLGELQTSIDANTANIDLIANAPLTADVDVLGTEEILSRKADGTIITINQSVLAVDPMLYALKTDVDAKDLELQTNIDTNTANIDLIANAPLTADADVLGTEEILSRKADGTITTINQSLLAGSGGGGTDYATKSYVDTHDGILQSHIDAISKAELTPDANVLGTEEILARNADGTMTTINQSVLAGSGGGELPDLTEYAKLEDLDTANNFTAINPTLDTPAPEVLDKVVTDINTKIDSIQPSIQPSNRKKVIEIAGTEQEFTVDLSPYKTYSKFHIEFPSSRSYDNITVSITGIQELLYGIESITMSGLDNDGTFLILSKQGTITFTLDSTDYEFPALIYHFGGFETGNGRIFLHIDYMEAKIGSPHKYMIENAIYGDAKLFDINTPVDSDNKYRISNHYKDNSTYLLKHNGVAIPAIYIPNPNALYLSITTIIGASEMLFYGRLYFYSHALNIPLMPILKPTGIIAYNEVFYGAMLMQVNLNGTYATNLYSYYAPKDVIWDYGLLRADLTDVSNWETNPTEFGMYRITVKGTYLQGLLVA
jgi:hypothetical protein